MKNVFKLTIGIVLLTLVFSSLGWSQSTADIVLIIDSSGSMVENDPNDLRKAAARQLIDLADSDVQIGIVDFDSDAVTLKELTSANKDGKSELKNAVGRIDAYDGTNIAAGLQQGFDVLSKSKTFTARKAAVLLTDGEDNEPTTLDAYVGNYVKEGWSVYTIGLDDGVSLDRALLEAIAAETLEGEYYSVTVDNIQSVYHKILAKITWKSVVLASPSGYINQDQTIEKRVKIDGWVTQANFTLNWTGSTVEMVLVDPSGAEITPDTAATLGISYQAAPTYAIYTVDNPMQGEWKMRLTGTDIPPEGEAYGIVVTGASDFITNLLAFEPSYAIGDTVRIGIRIEEKTGDTAHPIIGATTSATVVRPDGRIETINLFDDGVHNDNAAGDGIYAGNYTNVDILGTYLIRVSVQNGFSREIQQQIIVGDIDNVFVDGSTLIPAAGATLNRAPRSISAVISGPARKIDSESIVLKIDGKVVAHTYDVVNQLVSFQPTRLSRGTHTVSLSVNNTIETNWSFITASGVASRFDTLMVLLNEELNTLEETDLAQNYPNPFNPETWIPYQLSEPTDVSIQIYDSSGHLVRTLDIGVKTAGAYRTRSRAAYWDGKNEIGERVANGTYFYTLRTPEFSATRRMVILK
ncbi:MAG: VWA domain-containing protein [Candidatus Poribacteria bacterium]|nr:VWA domain-containing protein [Candidatus Poribacteria bacterium]